MVEVVETSGPPLGGIRYDIPKTYIPAEYASGGKNFDLSGACIQKRRGLVALGANLAKPSLGFLQYTKFDLAIRTVVCMTDDILQYLPTTDVWESILGEATWSTTIDHPARMAVMLDTLIITNHVDPILSWSGSGAVGVVGGASGYLAKDIEPFKERLLLFNTTESDVPCPQRIRWPSAGSYSNFAAGGFVDLVDTPGPILCGKKLGEGLAVYKSDSIIYGYYMGSGSTFGFDTRVIEHGLVAPLAVIKMNSAHLYLAQDNVYMFTGARDPQPIGDPVKDQLLGLCKADYIQRSIGIRLGSQAWFVVPTTSEYPDTVFVYDLRRNTWFPPFSIEATCLGHYVSATNPTLGDVAGRLSDYKGRIGEFSTKSIFPNVVVGNYSGDISLASLTATTDNGVVIESSWETGVKVFMSDNVKHRPAVCRYRYVDVEARGDSLSVEYSLDEGKLWKAPVDALKALTSDFNWYRFDFDDLGSKIMFRFRNSGTSLDIRSFAVAALKDVII